MRDEVDELIEAWERERSDLDLAPVAVFSRISRLARHLDLARREAFTAHGIESWEFDVLAALRRAGAPYELSPGRLLRETLVTSGTMTNRVDRLAARGLVERYPDPDDRRGVIVRLTTEGKAAVDGAFEALLTAEAAAARRPPGRRAEAAGPAAAPAARAVRLRACLPILGRRERRIHGMPRKAEEGGDVVHRRLTTTQRGARGAARSRPWDREPRPVVSPGARRLRATRPRARPSRHRSAAARQ